MIKKKELLRLKRIMKRWGMQVQYIAQRNDDGSYSVLLNIKPFGIGVSTASNSSYSTMKSF